MCRAFRAAVSLAGFALPLLALSGCDITFLVVTGPSPAGTIIVISDPKAVSALTIPGAICPGSPPFLVHFRLIVREGRGIDVQVREVRLRFVDRNGVTGLDLLLSSADLGRQFDSTLVAAHSSRDFPFSPRFGCAGDPVGVLYVLVVLVDANGSSQTSEVQIAIA